MGVLAALARLLTPAEFGVVAAATLVLGLTYVFWQLGVGPALIQRRQITPEHIETGFTLSLILGILFSVGVALTAP